MVAPFVFCGVQFENHLSRSLQRAFQAPLYEEALIYARPGRGRLSSALWGQDLALYRWVQGEVVMAKLWAQP